MRAEVLLLLGAVAYGCVPACNRAPAAPAGRSAAAHVKQIPADVAHENESTFIGTVTEVGIGNLHHPFLRWVVVLKVDQVISGPSPGEGFWFAIHSPSQEGVKVGQRYRILVKNEKDGYELISRVRLE